MNPSHSHTHLHDDPHHSTKERHVDHKEIPIRVHLLLVGDTLGASTEKDREKLDVSGKVAQEIIEQNKYQVVGKEYIPDEKDQIASKLHAILESKPDLVITIGGTGLSKRDVTIEAVSPFFSKELIGFGELFRMLTYQEVGTVSIMTRATAGIRGETAIVCLPGSPNAVKLGVGLILKEIVHLILTIKKG